MVISFNDRVIRTFHYNRQTRIVNDSEWLSATGMQFRDNVDKQNWNACGFSADGEYVLGASAHRVEHNLFIWDCQTGRLVKMLEGPKETLVDFSVLHYTRSMF